jgi:hypothetical protein
MRDQVPYIGTGQDGHDTRIRDGAPFHHVGIAAHRVGWADSVPSTPATFADMNPAAYDARKRIHYLDSVCIWAQSATRANRALRYRRYIRGFVLWAGGL